MQEAYYTLQNWISEQDFQCNDVGASNVCAVLLITTFGSNVTCKTRTRTCSRTGKNVGSSVSI